MIHPDYQYTPQTSSRDWPSLVGSGLYPCVLASRILGGGALDGGMPWWKYIANRFLTFIENFLIGAKLSEYHTVIARSRGVCSSACQSNKTPMISYSTIRCSPKSSGSAAKIGEVTCPAKYLPEGSSINFRRSVRMASVVLERRLRFRLARGGCSATI